MQTRALLRAVPPGLRRAVAIAAALVALAPAAPARAADPPSGYKDVTTYKSTSWGSSFDPLVPNDPSKATANASNLNKMIAANVVLYFPAGTYWIDKTITIGKAGVTLWGDEGAVICRTGVPNTCETAFPLGSFNDTANFMVTANNFKMHGLAIKYDVPTSFTGVITAKSSNTATVRLTDGKSASFSADVAISRVNYFDENLRPSGNETFFEAGSKLGISNLSEDENGVKSFKCTLKGSSVGQRVAMACGSNYGQNIIIYGASASGVQNTVFEDVTVANSFGMVMLVKGATNLTLERFRVDDGDTNTIYTASVDGIHVAALGGKLTMRDCEFNGLADDILNVHCGGPKVGSVSGNTVTFESGVESVYFQRNHTVRFYSSKLAPLGTATVTAVSGSVSGITVDALPSGVAAGCYVANESWLPEVEITGTKVGVTRARGFLLQTDKPVTIADCEFENTRLAGILCAPGASWGEMGPVNGVTVSNCTFRACGAGVASTANNGNAAVVVRCDHDADAATTYGTSVQRDVWIGDCFFEDCPASAVNAVNATGLVVTNNVFLRCGGGVPAQDSCMVRFRRGDGATVVFNTAYGGGFTNDVLNLNSSTHVEAHDNGFRDESEWGGSAFSRCLDKGYAIATDNPGGGVRVFPAAEGGTAPVAWSWSCRDDPNFKGAYNLLYCSDVKVRDGGKTLLLMGASDWAVVDADTGVCQLSGVTGSNGHGIEMLPDGSLLVADADGWLHHVAKDGSSRRAVAVPSCHGVEWDPARQCVWVIGNTNLLRFAYDSGTRSLSRTAAYSFPNNRSGGHMIELCPEDGRIYLTCSGFVACFDPDAGTMSEVYSLYNAKSVSRSAAYGNLVQVAKDGGSNANWNARKLRVYPAAGGTDYAEVEPSPVVDMYRAKWLRSAPARWAPARPVVGHPSVEVDGETSATFSLPVVSLPVPPATLTLSVSNAVAATATISSAGTAVLAASVVPGTTSPYQIELVDADGQRSIGRGVVTVPGGPPSILPVLGTPAVSRDGSGTFSVSVSVSSNAPASVVCVDRGNDYPMATADAGLPATYSVALSGLAAGTHQPSVQAIATDGTPVTATCPNAFHVGPLAVAAVADADAGALAPGVFRVSRADADPAGLPALSFDVAFSGPGLAFVVPPGVSSATIPAGAASVDIPVTPVFSEDQDEDLDLVLSVSGAYVGEASSATMKVLHADLDATVRYVAEDGDDANDGVSPALPKRTVANAVESLAAVARTRTCTVRVAPGTYTLAKETDDPITVTNAIRILGTGATPEDVVVRRIDRASANHSDYRNYQDLSLFHLNHPDALVANLVLHYGSAHQPSSDTTAGSAWIGANGGTISNCVVRGGRASHPYAITAGILMLGPGLVTHCVITNNSGTSAMEASWAKVWIANAVVMKGTGGRLENCLIRDNRSEAEGGTGSDKTSTVYATGTATLSNCTIAENRARNCAGVFADGTGVTVRNCVVAGNVDVGAAADNPNWMGTGTFAACATDDAEPVNGTCFSGSLAAFFPRLAEDVPVALKFRPAAGGPLCDRGVDYEPMAGVDLSGVQPRKIGAHVDIGCCEADPGSAPIAVPVLATRADDGVDPLGFGADPSDGSPTFEVTIRNAAGGVWYTVYAADEVGGTYKAAADSVQAESDGLLTLSIPAPSSVPARFVRIGASDSPVTGGTAL